MIGNQPSEREQWPEPCPHFVENACRSLANEARSALLPQGAAHLIRSDNAADLIALRDCDVKTPIAIAPRDRASNAPTRQLMEGAWRKHYCRAWSGLLVGDRLHKSSQIMSPVSGQ